MRVTDKGQVTIPQDIRERAGLMPGTDVEFVEENGRVVIRKAEGKGKKPTRGEEIVARLRGTGSSGMTTDEIMELMRGPRDDLDRLERAPRRDRKGSGVGRVVGKTTR
jgi:AbrB family looped-hinge helix DNA binding protein